MDQPGTVAKILLMVSSTGKMKNGYFPVPVRAREFGLANKWRTISRGYRKFDFTVDEGKGRLNPPRDKKSRLCDPGWCVHKSDVQNKRDDNTHTTHILL